MPDLPVCVYCRRRPAESRWRPFCSPRCQLLDLAHWVDGDYRVPGEPVTDEAVPDDSASHEERPDGTALDPDDRGR